MRRLVESNLIGIVISRPDGLIIDANDAFLAMLDIDARDLTAHTLSMLELTPRELREKEQQLAAQVTARGEHPPYEKELCSRQGKRIPVLVGTAAIAGDEPLHVSFVLDLTELKAAEAERDALLVRERAARAEAESANRSKDEFLATLSHELRTPMTSILGWARMLEQGGLDAELTRVAVEAIKRSSTSQAQLIEDLLDVSRIAVGKFRVEMELLDVRDPVRIAVEHVTPAADSKRVSLTVSEIDHDLPVCGDAQRLQQVVWNLLNNAIKFTQEGGWVRIELGRSDASATIVVADNGAGIDPEFLPHVFERFRQADASTTRSHTGLGLGLALVRHIVELHGGQVTAASEGLGHGSRFTVTLPLDQRSIRTTKESGVAVTPATLQRVNALVVDDEDDVRTLIVAILSQAGATVIAVPSTADAREALERSGFDVVVTDIAMPEEDGYALLKFIRTNGRNEVRELPVVAVTAHARPEDEAEILSAGFDKYVRKPLDPQQFVRSVKDLIEARPRSGGTKVSNNPGRPDPSSDASG